MFETKYSKVLTILLIIIVIAILGLGGFLLWNLLSNHKTTNDANEFVSSFIENDGGDVSVDIGGSTSNNNESSNQNTNGSLTDSVKSASDGNNKKKVKTYKGFNVIGTIEIPKTKVKYPVLEEPSTIKKLEVAVAAIYPRNAEINKPGNVVIVGHNYRNGLFFSNNKKLSEGDKIYLTDLNERKIEYKIYKVFVTSENDTEFYNRDTDGKMEVTLSTCTDASDSQRLVIFARAE